MVTLDPTRDNTLIEISDGSLSNGAFNELFVGLTGQPAGRQIRRGILAFDVAASIPAGATIQSVRLDMLVVLVNVTADVSLHSASQDWGEGASVAGGGGAGGAAAEMDDVTWLHTFFETSFWTSAGGDFAALASATTNVNSVKGLRPSWSSEQMTADVQAWLDTPAQDFGWVIVGDETVSGNALSFGSREQASAADRPQLLVEYVPEPSAGLQSGVGLLGLWLQTRARTRRG